MSDDVARWAEQEERVSDDSCYDDDEPIVTASGRVLDDDEIERLSTEAEFGYEQDAEGRWGSNMNRLLDTTDAREWAAAFEHQFRVSPNPDEGTMLAWFAGALETGRRQGRQELCPHPRDDVGTYGDVILCRVCGKNVGENVEVGDHL